MKKSWSLILLSALLPAAQADEQILKTTTFSNCANQTSSSIDVHKINISYNNSNKSVIFDVSGTSEIEQKVSATLHVTAYGKDIYTNHFNPCDKDTLVQELCPVPKGTFSAHGSQDIPSEYASMVPGIAFQIPDIAAQATLSLKSLDTGKDVACITSQVSNGKTADVPAVSYVVAGAAALALMISAATAAGTALAGGSVGGLGTISPSFGEVFGVFQGMAMNGMHSVNYPPIYRSFAKNFGFSTSVIAWDSMQRTIDTFRSKTGGNLTLDSVDVLKNATLVFPDGTSIAPSKTFGSAKRSMELFNEILIQVAREVQTSDSNDTSSDSGSAGLDKPQLTVSGISAYVEQLSVPKSNVFMTALLIVAIVIAAIAASLLLVKLILELWALFGNFPKGLAGFRKHYWGSIARTITSLILLLYGVWVLYCIFQFTHGDSTVAKALAAVTLAIFTAILAFFTWKIWSVAHKLKNSNGDASALYEDKKIWVKYSLFYDAYRKNYWWLFVPTIVYMFAKGCTLAAADGHGMAQTIAQLVIEAVMLGLLVWSRPYERRSGNIINIVIQVVRVLSVCCILVFVEEFGIAQTTQTITGVVLIVVQSVLTGVLIILMMWNGIAVCCRENPHRKRRKEMGMYSPFAI